MTATTARRPAAGLRASHLPGSFTPMLPGDQATARLQADGSGCLRAQVTAELVIEPELVTAALYGYPSDDLDDELAAELIAAELVIFGLDGLRQRADLIAAAERTGTLDAPAWLATCRQYASSTVNCPARPAHPRSRT